MPARKKTYKRKRTSTKKRTYKRKRYSTRYRKKGGTRVNIPSTGRYSGSETIRVGGFNSEQAHAQQYRFDAVQLPRLTALAPEFKQFKITRATLRIVPQQAKTSWYNVQTSSVGNVNQGKQMVTYIKKDGIVSYVANDLEEARLMPNARFHSMQTTMRRSFTPMVIKEVQMVHQGDNATKPMVQFCNPWLDTRDPNSYIIDRTALAVYSPPLTNIITQNAYKLGFDVYIDVKYQLRGVQHIVA